MQFTPDHCPECGKIAVGTIEKLTGLALISFTAEGEAFYDGETKIDWDSQKTDRDSWNRATLECAEGHQWGAEMVEDEV
jgi:hypothetical protein